jgi:hypothetical protein
MNNLLKPEKISRRKMAVLYSMYIDFLLLQNQENRYKELETLKKAINFNDAVVKAGDHFDLFFQTWAHTEGIKIEEL